MAAAVAFAGLTDESWRVNTQRELTPEPLGGCPTANK